MIGGSIGQFPRFGVVPEVLRYPAGDFGDGSRYLTYLGAQLSGRGFDERFHGLQIAFHQRLGVVRTEGMFGLDMDLALVSDHGQDITVNRKLQQKWARQTGFDCQPEQLGRIEA